MDQPNGSIPGGARREGSATRIDRACDEFEAAWAARQRPSLEDRLRQAPEADRPALLRELLILELEYRTRAGERPTPAEYRARFREYAAIVDDLLPAPARAAEDGADLGMAGRPEARGRYTLTPHSIRGGISQVWLARDPELGRDVALKELLPESVEDPALWGRFLEEARITGQLQHPGIVPVYELDRRPGDGRPGGRQPFYTMQFVRGRTLAQAIGDYHRDRAAGRAGPLKLSGLPEAFIAVCHTVAYAHARGVLHRDLKPSNVMVGNFGEVLVLDWGLAKLADAPEGPSPEPPVTVPPRPAADRTASGQVVGTPAYMAPEQAEGRGRVDHRADVYGLGAILYEILTGRPPFQGEDSAEILRRLQAEAPPRPRQLLPATPAPLEAICLKAMAREPAGRYDSAEELGREVRRWLTGDELVTAYHYPWWARLGHWMRRHRTAVGVAAAMLATGAVALAIGFVVVSLQKQETERQRVKAEANFARAEVNFARARDAVDAMLSEVGSKDLVDVPLMEPVRRRLLERARSFYEDFLRDQDTDAVRHDAGLAYRNLGDIRSGLGQPGPAEQAFRRAIALLQAAVDEAPRPESRDDLAWALAKQALALGELGRLPQALAAYRRAIPILEELTDEVPDDPDYRRHLSDARNDLALVLKGAGREDEAQAEFRKALDLIEGRGAASVDDRRRLARIHSNFGALLVEIGSLREAEQQARRAHDLQVQLVAQLPHIATLRKELTVSSLNLGGLLSQSGRFAEAEPYLDQGIALAERLIGDFPDIPLHKQHLAGGLYNKGDLLSEAGRLRDAEAPLTRAVALQEALLAAAPGQRSYRYDLAKSLFKLGYVLGMLQKRDAAEGAWRRSEELFTGLAAEFPSDRDYPRRLGRVYFYLGLLHEPTAPRQAEADYRAAIDLQEALVDRASPGSSDPALVRELGLSLSSLAFLLTRSGRPVEAEAICRRLVATFEDRAADPAATSLDQDLLGRACGHLAFLRFHAGDLVEARRLYEQGIPRVEAVLRAEPKNPVHPANLRQLYSGLTGVLMRLGEHAALARAAETWTRILPDDPSVSYDAACMLTFCSTLARGDNELVAGQREAWARSYADRAMGRLHDAVRKGFKDAKHLESDSDLAPLRPRADFRLLLLDLTFPSDPFTAR